MNNILTTNVQVQNNINWTKYDTLQDSLNDTMMYPKTYTIDNRVV